MHLGHLIVSRAAAETLQLGGVALLPASQSPHKSALKAQTPAHHRLRMLELAVAGDAFFGIRTLELERPAPSYSYDTVQQLFQQGVSTVHWLIGADQVQRLPAWHRATELVQCVEFHIAARPGWSFDFDELPEAFRQLRHKVVQTPTVDLSSTAIRERVRSGRSIRYMVPESVAAYIAEHELYRE